MREAVWVKKIEPFKYVPLLCKIGGYRHPFHNPWNNMLERCYNPQHKDYPAYGGKGVSVCLKWHNFQEYLRDIQSLPNFGKSGFVLDKDYYASNQYNPESCVWLPECDNIAYQGTAVYVKDILCVSHGVAATVAKVNRRCLSYYLANSFKDIARTTRFSLGIQRVRYAVKEGYVARYKE